jgi:FAD/FMN-containing dehydrogenase
VAGYALGGGEGVLTPKFGYACDNIVKAELVTSDCKLLTCDSEHNRALFWAVRGAGSNFGVAVSISFRLHPVSKVLAGCLKYPIDEAGKVLEFIQSTPLKCPMICLLALPFCHTKA